MMVAFHDASDAHSPSSDMMVNLKEDESMDNADNENDRSCASLDSAEYQASLDDLDSRGKRYFCQRCLNHGLEYQRKGHKPSCKYATCQCDLCLMVEQRRQINYQLSIRRPDDDSCDALIDGKKIRNPQCARCSAHGKRQALRGHKKASCPYNRCECEMCALVENRRNLMARQIRVRRKQQKQRQLQTDGSPEPVEASADVLFKPLPRSMTLSDDLIASFKRNPIKKKSQKTMLGNAGQSAFQPTVSASSTQVPTLSTASLFPSLFSGALSPQQLETFMKLYVQASQPQPQMPQTVPSVHPLLLNQAHQQSPLMIPSLGVAQLLRSNFPASSMPSIVNPFLLPCLQSLQISASSSSLPFQPFLSVNQRPS